MSATSTALLRVCSMLLCLVAGSQQLSIKEFVVPKAVEVGKDAELRCQYALGEGETEAALFVKWWWTPYSSSSDDRKQIYQRIAGQPPESIHHNNASKIDIKANDTIFLLDVNPVDSGTYECEVSNIDEIRQHDTLIVYTMGTGPNINFTVIKDSGEEEDKLLIECEAEDVAPLPDMTVTFHGDKINISKIVEDPNQDGLYKIYANATVSAKGTEESEVRCEMFYATLKRAPYVDVDTFIPSGRVLPPTTVTPEDATEPQGTTESLPNSSDDGVRLQYSWVLLTFATYLTYLQATF